MLFNYSAYLHQLKWTKADEGGGNKWHALGISKQNDRSSSMNKEWTTNWDM